jgi:23S rRNA (uracil1939-C5)-methyltransferase
MSEIISGLEITALTHGGRGLGRHDGKAVFVPLTVPGDTVTCRIKRSKKNFLEAELVEITKSSSARRHFPCPYFGQCGGCQWQHLPYLEQARWKEALFKDQLVRQGIAAEGVIKQIVAAPDEWHYRNRVQFKCSMTADGLVMGFYRHGSHFVVDVDLCMLLRPEIQQVYNLLRQELPHCPVSDAVPQVDVAVGDDEQVRVLLHALPHAKTNVKVWLRDFAEKHNLNACLQPGRKEAIRSVAGDPNLKVIVGQPELRLEYGAGGFAQVNSAQNKKMVDSMLSLLELTGQEKVVDLFCGMGNLSLPIARRAAKVIAVEDYAPSIKSARHNAEVNGISNAEFHIGDAATFLGRFGKGDLDLVVLDPPRTGSFATVKKLLDVMPERILYVSCDPATLARDLKQLVHNGYEVVSAQPFDLFPQTWHVESMTLLKKLQVQAQG